MVCRFGYLGSVLDFVGAYTESGFGVLSFGFQVGYIHTSTCGVLGFYIIAILS
jgi:hypothetical protein